MFFQARIQELSSGGGWVQISKNFDKKKKTPEREKTE